MTIIPFSCFVPRYAGRASSRPPARCADPPDQPASAAPGRSGTLITLVHKLSAVGKALIEATLRPADEDARTALRFGTFNITPIIARITRGLRLAEAREARVLRNARRFDHPPVRSAKPAAVTEEKPKRLRRVPTPTLSPEADDAALLAHLPSAKAIPEQVRRQPIGRVIEDICRDLGIDCAHPLWREIRLAILGHGGSLVRHLDRIASRNASLRTMLPGLGELPDFRPLPSPQPRPSAPARPDTGDPAKPQRDHRKVAPLSGFVTTATSPHHPAQPIAPRDDANGVVFRLAKGLRTKLDRLFPVPPGQGNLCYYCKLTVQIAPHEKP